MHRFSIPKPRAKSPDIVHPNESTSQDGRPKSKPDLARSIAGSVKSTSKTAKSTIEPVRSSTDKPRSGPVVSKPGTVVSKPGTVRSTPGTVKSIPGSVKSKSRTVRSGTEKSNTGSVKPTPRTASSTTASVKSRTEKWATDMVKYEPDTRITDMVKYEPQSPLRDNHSSHTSRESDRPKKPQCWDDVRCFSHDKQGNRREYWKIRELQIAAGKARKYGGAFEDYIPEESSLKRDFLIDGGSRRLDGTDVFFGRPYDECLDYIEKRGGPPPPVPETPGLPKDHYRP